MQAGPHDSRAMQAGPHNSRAMQAGPHNSRLSAGLKAGDTECPGQSFPPGRHQVSGPFISLNCGMQGRAGFLPCTCIEGQDFLDVAREQERTLDHQ